MRGGEPVHQGATQSFGWTSNGRAMKDLLASPGHSVPGLPRQRQHAGFLKGNADQRGGYGTEKIPVQKIAS